MDLSYTDEENRFRLEVREFFRTAIPADIQRKTVLGQRLSREDVVRWTRILHDKGFLEQLNDERPFAYRAARSYEEVSGRLLGDVLDRVFRGSREQLLVRLVEQRKLSARERAVLEEILKEAEA